jgi:hypothetical protein
MSLPAEHTKDWWKCETSKIRPEAIFEDILLLCLYQRKRDKAAIPVFQEIK